MNSETSQSPSGNAQAFLSAWATSVCDVLRKITGTAFAPVELAPGEAAELSATLNREGVWLRFRAEKALHGEQAFGVTKAQALRLAQILMGEPANEAQDFSTDYQDAAAELFRQFAGQAALALKPQAGGEVSLPFSAYGAPNWKPHTQWGLRLKGEGAEEFLLLLAVDPVLGESLAPAPPAQAAAPAPPSRASAPNPPGPSVGNRNIDLLLDVELQVALRFGKREMPLGEILELSAGAVVELDQKLLDPVELLVGGKVVAHGEVVVLDGHYALRVTQVVNPVERLESLAG